MGLLNFFLCVYIVAYVIGSNSNIIVVKDKTEIEKFESSYKHIWITRFIHLTSNKFHQQEMSTEADLNL